MHGPIIPWDSIRNLPLPNLAMALLATQTGDSIILNNVLGGMRAALKDDPQNDHDTLLARIADAWAWLEAHSLIAAHDNHLQTGPVQRVSETGRALIQDPDAVAKVWADERLAGPLDPQLSSARSNFALGDYEIASFAAMKAVEVEVRRASGLPSELVGVLLMRKAFDPQGGPLTDPGAEGGEKEATANLFAGAIGTFKNPASHRTVDFDDAMEAAEVVQLANLLLRSVHRAGRRTVDS